MLGTFYYSYYKVLKIVSEVSTGHIQNSNWLRLLSCYSALAVFSATLYSLNLSACFTKQLDNC